MEWALPLMFTLITCQRKAEGKEESLDPQANGHEGPSTGCVERRQKALQMNVASLDHGMWGCAAGDLNLTQQCLAGPNGLHQLPMLKVIRLFLAARRKLPAA